MKAFSLPHAAAAGGGGGGAGGGGVWGPGHCCGQRRDCAPQGLPGALRGGLVRCARLGQRAAQRARSRAEGPVCIVLGRPKNSVGCQARSGAMRSLHLMFCQLPCARRDAVVRVNLKGVFLVCARRDAGLLAVAAGQRACSLPPYLLFLSLSPSSFFSYALSARAQACCCCPHSWSPQQQRPAELEPAWVATRSGLKLPPPCACRPQTGQVAARQMVEQNKAAPGRGGVIINMSSVGRTCLAWFACVPDLAACLACLA